MLPAMLPRRVQPLAGWSIVVVFALIGAALLATVWSTRASILDASNAVRCGQADAVEQAVRAELSDLDGVPTTADLATILHELHDDGLRYIAMLERSERGGGDPDGSAGGPGGRAPRGIERSERGGGDPDGSAGGPGGRAPREIPRGIEVRGPRDVVAAAGAPVGSGGANLFARSRAVGCKADEAGGRLRMELRTLRRLKSGGRTLRFLIEVEPVQANSLREAASLTLAVGALAAAALLGVAFVLIRREARRQADAAARERERRLASLGEMSAVLAHEIKNPLASLKGNAQLLARMLPGGDKPRAKADRVVDEAMRLEQLTNDLLQFVRTGTIQRTPVDPAALVRDAASSVAGDVMVDATGAPATWSLDAGRIRQVVINLIDNAVAAGPPVTVAVRAGRGHLILEVADRGPGVAEDDRDRIFEPFFTGKTQGTGLGLAIVRRVVELHGGTIAVHPNPGGGAMFRAEIPAS
jgi:two-component system sensor histidine kinase HydH